MSGNPWVIDVGARLASGLLMSVSVPDYYSYDFVKATYFLHLIRCRLKYLQKVTGNTMHRGQ